MGALTQPGQEGEAAPGGQLLIEQEIFEVIGGAGAIAHAACDRADLHIVLDQWPHFTQFAEEALCGANVDR